MSAATATDSRTIAVPITATLKWRPRRRSSQKDPKLILVNKLGNFAKTTSVVGVVMRTQ
jgi:hypothetical protein